MRTLLTTLCLALVALVAFPATSHAATFLGSTQKNQPGIAITTPITDDVFVAGSSITTSAAVTGELFGMAGTVSIGAPVSRSVALVASSITLDSGAGYNAYLVGSSITLDGTYGHDVYVVGSSVTIKKTAVIKGSLYVAGASATIDGTIAGNVYTASAQTTSGATVGGDFKGSDGFFTFTGGSIGGNLTYTSKQVATDLNKVSVAGNVTKHEPSSRSDVSFLGWLLTILWSVLSVFVLGAVLIGFFSKQLDAAHAEVSTQWAASFARGFLVLILGPALAVLGFTILFGWQVSLVLIALYIAFLVLAYGYAVTFLGRWLLHKTTVHESRWYDLIVGALALAIASSVPVLGVIVGIIFFFAIYIPSLGTFVSRYETPFTRK